MSIQQLPQQEHRVETGVVQFGDDWPGIFIRGDNAFPMALALREKLEGRDHPIMVEPLLRDLLELLESSNVHRKSP